MHSQIQTRVCTNKGSFYSIADTGFKIKKQGPVPAQHPTIAQKRNQKARSPTLHFFLPPLDPLPGRMISFSGLSIGIREEGEGGATGATGATSGSSSVAMIFFPLLFDVPCFFLLFEEDSLPGVTRADKTTSLEGVRSREISPPSSPSSFCSCEAIGSSKP